MKYQAGAFVVFKLNLGALWLWIYNLGGEIENGKSAIG